MKIKNKKIVKSKKRTKERVINIKTTENKKTNTICRRINTQTDENEKKKSNIKEWKYN